MSYILFSEIRDICELLSCSMDNLYASLTRKSVEVRGEKVKTDLNVAGVSIGGHRLKVKYDQNLGLVKISVRLMWSTVGVEFETYEKKYNTVLQVLEKNRKFLFQLHHCLTLLVFIFR